MGQALYRKYRSKSLSEIVGQEHITDTLGKALKQGRISHAYLFTGPRGVGKTSIARILAHEINNLPYTDESTHMDIIEIDAASNRRIDEIRELRDKVYVAPTSAKYKVYIIDEVHMLTREAFNALLKTLEEPPAHVVFMLATTDAHKLPETIISRTQRYSFRPVELAKVVEHLRFIAKQEKITISDEALKLLAEHGEGSFRDSISLLDQASSHGHAVSLEDVQNLLGMPSQEAIAKLVQSLGAPDTSPALLMQQLTDLYDQGFQAAAIAKQLGQQLRLALIAGLSTVPAEQIVRLLASLIEVPVAHEPARFLEITLLGALPPSAVQVRQPLPVVRPEPAARPDSTPEQHIEVPETKAQAEPQPKPTPHKGKAPKTTAPAGGDDFMMVTWPRVLTELKKSHNTLYGIVRMARPTFSAPDKLELAFAFAFHQKRLNDAKHRQLLADTIEQAGGGSIYIECIVDKTVKPSTPPVLIADVIEPPAEGQTPADLAAISTIFGSAEVIDQ